MFQPERPAVYGAFQITLPPHLDGGMSGQSPHTPRLRTRWDTLPQDEFSHASTIRSFSG